MTLQKLSAGSGYEYLTRQVAALDSTEKGSIPLADYYAAKGEAPGRWIGSGLGGIDGLAINDVVTAEQMKHLFGSGCDPTSGRPLGAAYKIYANETVDAFCARVDELLGHVAAPTPAQRARARSTAAREFFVAEHGREPATAQELSTALAKYSRPRQTAVAGFDLTFSPVKSVSALWAIAPPEVATKIEQAHQAAVADALAFIEDHALFTREGKDGVRQVETRGLIAAVFTHRESRAGDPDLHTHVAVANKVQTKQGKWLSIYGRVLHQHVVAASETYNTALGRHLVETLGVAVRRATGRQPGEATHPRDRRHRSRALRSVVAPASRHRGPAARTDPRLPQRSRPYADAGRGRCGGPTGEPGNARGQARAAISGRAEEVLAEPGHRRTRVPGGCRSHGAGRAPSDRRPYPGQGVDLVGAGGGRARDR
jgi:hypothetical protein